MKTLRTLIASLSAVLLALNSISAAGPGTTTGELLKIPVNARAVGMGEAFVGMADDSSSLYWNPAGLSLARQKEVTFGHSSLLEGIHYEHLAFMAPGDNYSIGASMSYLGYGSIAGYDQFNNAIGDQTAYAYILNGGMSTMLKDRLSLGVSASILRQTLADESAGTFAGNFGATYLFTRHPLQADYRLGLSVLNVGPGLKFVSERDPLPRKIKLGAAVLHLKEWPLNLTADLTFPNDNDTYFGIGSEYWFKQLVALRLGYAGSNDEGRGLRMGFGLKLREFLLDYAYGGFGDFGATHRMNVSWRFGDKLRQLNPADKQILKEANAARAQGDDVREIMAMKEILEKNPDDTRALKRMIVAHERMLKKELNEAVAQANTEEAIPDVETFATNPPLPGQENLVNAVDDPMGYENLPSAENLDGSLDNPLAAGFDPNARLAPAKPEPEQAIPSTMGSSGAEAPSAVETPSASADPSSPVVDSAVPDEHALIAGDAPTSTPAPVDAPVEDIPSPDAPLLNPSDFK